VTGVAVSIGAATAGALVVLASLPLLSRVLTHPPHVRQNYRGRAVFATAGTVLVGALVAGSVAALASAEPGMRTAVVMLGAGVAAAALGLADDVYGDRHAGGLRGHARELVGGRLTTGMIKAAGGAAVGLASAWFLGRRGVWVIVGGAVVALSANLANLLDLRPGRTLKVWFVCAVALLYAGVPGGGEPMVSGIGGGALVFAVYELRERVMLGDTGAGLLGATLGVAAVASLGERSLLVVLGVLGALTLVSEVVSFSKAIEAIPPLRWADRLGRATSKPGGFGGAQS
jgi:UDP-N-acetylmuramyl pentapeptide phosphotransferase/UDP-N-acetylglucosamine-1-phosphate transferase